jgi:YggT family protein
MPQVDEPRPGERDEIIPAGPPRPATGVPGQASGGLEHTEQVVQSAGGIEHREQVITDAAGSEHRERAVRNVAAERRLRVRTASQVIWLVVGIIDVLIGLRVGLKLIAANPENDFARFIYDAAGLFLAPFFGLTGSPSAGGMVLEIPSLIAMLIYALAGWGLVRVIRLLLDRPTTRSTDTFDRYRS